jgi:hypothetical protein
VQLFPSLHAAPLLAIGLEQAPVVGSQVPATWHWSDAVQATGLEPLHVPFWQVSVWVQPLPSLQDVPLLAMGFEQAPVDGSHEPATWH